MPTDVPVLLSEDRDKVRILRLNRPDKLNALNTALTQALLDAFADAENSPDVAALVLTGNGRAFCAGADLDEFAHLTPANQAAVEARAELTCRCQMAMQAMSKPVVSAVRGAAVGGGAGLGIGADMMVAATDLKFGYPELRHSIVPALVMTGLQRAVGRKIAFELVSLGRLIGAEEAHAIGIANRIVAPERVEDEALDIARAWAAATPAAMAACKTLYYRVAELPWEAAMAEGKRVNAAMRAFRDARP